MFKISGPTYYGRVSSLLVQTKAADFMKTQITAVFVLIDWAWATLNMAELLVFPFVTFYYPYLTHSCLNETLIMAAQVCGNNGIPFSMRKDWSHFIGFFLSATNQCLEWICLQYSMVVSMNETHLIIRSLLEDFQTAISKTNWKNSQNETGFSLCSLKGLLSNNDRQEPWTMSRVQWGDKAKASWEKERVIMAVYVL